MGGEERKKKEVWLPFIEQLLHSKYCDRPLSHLLLNSQKTQGGSYFIYKGKMGRAIEEEERNEGVSDLAQPCIFLVKKRKARGQLICG